MGELGKLIIAKGIKNCPKSNKSPNLVTLCEYYLCLIIWGHYIPFYCLWKDNLEYIVLLVSLALDCHVGEGVLQCD